jgi:hypothetical protein
MSAMQMIVNIFSAPTKAFESLNEKPTWLLPFIIAVVVVVGYQYVTLDITMDYQMAKMEAKDMPEQQLEVARQQMSGSLKYVGMIVAPIFMPIVWSILAGLLLGASKITIPDGLNFKKVFSIIAWSSLVSLAGMILLAFLILSKGSMHGVVLDLSAFLTTPPIGTETPVINRIFSKIDPFVIWQIALWVIGLKVMGKSTTQKAVIPVAVLWIFWVIVSVSLGGFFENLGM